MLKQLSNWISQYFVERELNKHIANEELFQLFPIPTQIVREQHETYKLGEFTCTVVADKQHLENKLLLTKVERIAKQNVVNTAITDLAFNNLVPMDE